MTSPTYQKMKQAIQAIRQKTTIEPKVGMILGSGLGSLADEIVDRSVIAYRDIPGFHGTSVEGHAGQMVIGKLKGVEVVCLQGRFHLYEGYPMEDVVFPTRTICGLGIHTLVLTNAAGGVNTRYRPCDIMLIEDHLNLMGDNPLKGPHMADLGPRFTDLTSAYDPDCLKILELAAKQNKIEVHRGVYAALLGPTYETPAEIKMLRLLGADAVGMSTVPESIAANQLGVRVCGVSCITNLGAGTSPQKLTHQEVIDNSKIGAVKIKKMIEGALPSLATTGGAKS